MGNNDNPIYSHNPEEFFDAEYLQIARAIRSGEELTLASILRGDSILFRPIDVNLPGRQGMTLLLWAASHNNIKAVETLLKNGADPNRKIVNLKGDTIQLLAISAKGKSDALFDLLLEYGADPDSRDRDEPALFSAIYADRFDRMHKILEAGGDINITNQANTPAIVVLTRLRKYGHVIELLDRGATLTPAAAKDIGFLIRKYPLEPVVADYENQRKVKQILINNGFKF